MRSRNTFRFDRGERFSRFPPLRVILAIGEVVWLHASRTRTHNFSMCSCTVFTLRWPQFFFSWFAGWHYFNDWLHQHAGWTVHSKETLLVAAKLSPKRRWRLISGWKRLPDTNYQIPDAAGMTMTGQPVTTRAITETPIRIFSMFSRVFPSRISIVN